MAATPRSTSDPLPESSLAALGVPVLVTGGSLLLFGKDQLPDVVMVYLLGIMLVSSRFGLMTSVVSALFGIAAFDFFFVPPYFTFAVTNLRHTTTFVVMFLVALVISGLTQRSRNQMAAALEARRQVENEQLRSSLLSSISHDLRTPLAVITGATSTLLEGKDNVSDATRRELLETVLEESERLNLLIRNLLDMTRLESGAVKVHKEWLPFEELIGAALNRLETRLEGRSVRVDLPQDLPLVPCDAVLVEQVLINLLENAASYGSGEIAISARASEKEVTVEVADRGPGIPAGEETRVFEKFHRSAREGHPEGVGLGLTICRAIVAVHGGRIEAENREGGGAVFRFALPIEGSPPALPAPEGELEETRV